MKIPDLSLLQILLGAVSALVLFLYAIENLSKELQHLASEKFRVLISKLVNNSFKGTVVGALATAVTQSSSAVTVIAVVLVNTGIISFTNSLGIIFGSNIGTTITAQLALVNSSAVASVLIVLGFLLGVVHKKTKILSKPVFFLGLILLTLNLLSASIEPLRNSSLVMDFFSHLSNPVLAYLVSAIFTMIVHSSSVTSGIVVILALGNIIPIEVAIPMVLGANLGSSVTALIASSRLSLHARRAGFANFLFNLLGTLLFMLLLSPFVSIMESLVDGPAQQTAWAHLIFNVVNTGVFLLFLKPFEGLIKFLVKGDEEEVLFETKYVHKNNGNDIQKNVLNINRELAYSIENTVKIYEGALSIFYDPSPLVLMVIQKLETLNDFLDDEITASIIALSKFKLTEKDAQQTVALVKISNTIEQLGDLGTDLSETFLRMHDLGINPGEVDIERLEEIHAHLIDLFREMERVMQNPKEKELVDIKGVEEEIYCQIRTEFDLHVKKLQGDSKYNGNVFVDAISIIEISVSKVRDIRKLLLEYVRKYPENN